MNLNPSTSLQCGVCYEKYSSKTLPVSLPQCGHTFCQECTQKVLSNPQKTPNCPFCQKDFIFLPKGGYLQPQTNYALLGVMQESYMFGVCSQHCLPYEYMCLVDKKSACSKCCLFGEHQGHKIKELEQVKKECDSKIKMLEDAYRETRACLPKIQAELVKRQQESIQIANEVFNETKKIKEEQKLEWKMKIAQEYEKEELRLIIDATANQRTEMDLKNELDYYKTITLEDLYDIDLKDVQNIIKVSRKHALCSNTEAYCTALSQVSEQLNKSLIKFSSKMNIPFPDLSFPRSNLGFPFREKEEDTMIVSCLCLDLSKDSLMIRIQKTQRAVEIKNIYNWKQAHKIIFAIDNIWISDHDYDLLKALLSNLNCVKDIEISFSPEITVPLCMKYNFQNLIINLMKIFFENKVKLTQLSVAWNGSHGGEIALGYLKSQVLAGLNLEFLKIMVPNTKDIVPIQKMYGCFISSRIFCSNEIKQLLKNA